MARRKQPQPIRGKALGNLLSTIDMPEWMTVAEAAKLMFVSTQRVRQLCLSGVLSARKTGRDWLIPRKRFLEYASEEHKVGRPPAKEAA